MLIDLSDRLRVHVVWWLYAVTCEKGTQRTVVDMRKEVVPMVVVVVVRIDGQDSRASMLCAANATPGCEETSVREDNK